MPFKGYREEATPLLTQLPESSGQGPDVDTEPPRPCQRKITEVILFREASWSVAVGKESGAAVS